MELKSVISAVDLVTCSIKVFSNYYCWFRGQSNADWNLAPAVFRLKSPENFVYDEYNLTYEMRLIKPDVKFDNTFEWLVYAQHYGLPTRLLDWTESILVALFFASADEKVDGKLFVLIPSLLNKITSIFHLDHICLPDFADANLRALQAISANFDELYARLCEMKIQYQMPIKKLKKEHLVSFANLPIAVIPPRSNVRINVQSGMFTIHGGNSYTLSHKSDFGVPAGINSICNNDSIILTEYIIPSFSKSKIRYDLSKIGIHEGSLFPEFESQANYIRNKRMFSI